MRWLTHGEISASVISRFKSPFVLITEKRDKDVKGIRDQMLSPKSILMFFY